MTDKKDMRYEYKIYKISSDLCDKFYIGSTRNMASRKRLHKSRSNDVNHNSKIYKTIRENHGWENWNMGVIEVMENTTKLEAEIREEEWRMKLKATLNDRMVTRGHMTKEEYDKRYREEHKDYHKEYHLQHYAENRDRYIEYGKLYRKENKDLCKEYHKQYREENRDKINEKSDCECGGKFTNSSKARHSKTIKHQQYLNTLGKSI